MLSFLIMSFQQAIVKINTIQAIVSINTRELMPSASFYSLNKEIHLLASLPPMYLIETVSNSLTISSVPSRKDDIFYS